MAILNFPHKKINPMMPEWHLVVTSSGVCYQPEIVIKHCMCSKSQWPFCCGTNGSILQQVIPNSRPWAGRPEARPASGNSLCSLCCYEHHHPQPRFTQHQHVSPPDLAESQSCKVWYQNDNIAQKIDRSLCSTAAEEAIKFHNNLATLNPYLAAWRFLEILW